MGSTKISGELLKAVQEDVLVSKYTDCRAFKGKRIEQLNAGRRIPPRRMYAFVKATAHGMGSAKRKGGIGKEQ